MIRAAPLLDELLETYSGAIGRDFAGYRGHCYRVLNYCAALMPDEASAIEKAAVTAAFHDLAIWTHGTFDYLEPSVELATAYLAESGKAEWAEEVGSAIREHHRMRRVGNGFVEAFRRADWIDVSGGLLRFGVGRAVIREAFAIWPSAGFHRRLVELGWARFKAHPLSPLPMLKW